MLTPHTSLYYKNYLHLIWHPSQWSANWNPGVTSGTHLAPPILTVYSLRKRQHYHQLPQVEYTHYKTVLVDHINGRAYAAVLRPSVAVCRLWRYVLWLNGASYSKSYYWQPTWSRVWEIDWYQNKWHWSLFRGCLRSCQPLCHIRHWMSRKPWTLCTLFALCFKTRTCNFFDAIVRRTASKK